MEIGCNSGMHFNPETIRKLARLCLLFCSISVSSIPIASAQQEKSIARQWNEQLLWAIRLDSARPTVHARNLFHYSIAMWDAWAAYDIESRGFLADEIVSADDINSARRQSISFAAYRLLMWRFKNSPNFIQTESSANRKMSELGYDIKNIDRTSDTPAALGNRIAHQIIEYGLTDGSNELNDYANLFYKPINSALNPHNAGNPSLVDPNRWQPLDIPNFVGQSGERSENYPPFVGPEWGRVKPFSLTISDKEVQVRGGVSYQIYLNPGSPPTWGSDSEVEYRKGFEQVIEWSSRLDPEDGLVIDVSPRARGNNTLGSNDGAGHEKNPRTGKPYLSEWVLSGDYYRALAEFWADGPSSETPPGHWFVMLNFATDQMQPHRKKFEGKGEPLNNLEWDVRSYLAMGGAMHDSAIAAWSNKGWYDYIRPISAIRHLCSQGQRTDPELAGYDEMGIDLKPGSIEVVTSQSSAQGNRHLHLAGDKGENVGKIAIKAWRGPDAIKNIKTDTAGVGWILCENWWPYQRPNFVTPPFAGYVSGHSTYSRAGAEILTLLTGSSYFPNGYAKFRVRQDEFLKFEKGPSRTFFLQWATYQDAADESAISRIYGGIHPPGDDIPGRFMGHKIGHKAFAKARSYFPL